MGKLRLVRGGGGSREGLISGAKIVKKLIYHRGIIFLKSAECPPVFADDPCYLLI